VESFSGKLAVVTGGGSGMGRELVRQLAAAGCSVAACDWHPAAVEQAAASARTGGAAVTAHACDASDEAQVERFRDELLAAHARDHVDLVFCNAGIGGGASFVRDSRDERERTFAVDWQGVHYCARVFLPLLIKSGDGVLVNTSSVGGFWATGGPGMPNTAYSAAKFAVRGFTEALIEDLRTSAPQVRAVVVLPGHVGTDILANSLRAHGLPEPGQMSDAQAEGLIPPRAGRAHPGRAAARQPHGQGPAPSAGAADRRLPGQGAAVRGRRGGRHPRRGPARGGYSPAKTSDGSMRRCAPGPKPPTTTPSCSARHGIRWPGIRARTHETQVITWEYSS
jgi:NAD(P)-dependent dehydrogenase (short-subunit alcohol dehydrogenase family)